MSESLEERKKMEVQDNRWCENCGVDRTKRVVRWYDWYGAELSFCNPCIKIMRGNDIGPFNLID